MFKHRIFMPGNLQPEVLESLHSAHQGWSSMEARAADLLWWPGLKHQIEDRHNRCHSCTVHAPSQSPLPPVSPPTPDYPMQQICLDIAHYNGNSYIVIVDRFSNWVSIYKFTKTEGCLKALRNHLIVHGVPDELSSDGGPEYTAAEVKHFLGRWGVRHRLSYYAMLE